MRNHALILLIVLLLSAAFLDAATTGRLAVRVRDGQGRAIEFVNIVVMQGTQRITGGQTNEKGTAIIINIPPGLYTVKFTLIGYGEVVYRDVRIQVDQTANLSPIMEKAGVRLSAVLVQVTDDKVEKDRVGSARQIEMDKMSDTAVGDIAGIISLQAGVTNIGGELHIRGGRGNEVNYTVDGMSVSDPVDGGATLQVDTDAISDMKVMTGGFPAEYGNAQSGVVNIVTKDGDAFYSGKFEYQTDHLGTTFGIFRAVELASRVLIDLEDRNTDVLKFAIGGPVIPFASPELKEKFTFYLNGAGEWLDGRMKKYFVADPNKDFTLNGRPLLDAEYPVYNPYEGRNNILEDVGINVGNRNYNSYNINLKTKYVINSGQNVTFAARGDRSYNKPFGEYGTDYSWRYANQHFAEDETNQKQYITTYDHVFNSTMNLKVKASYYQKDSYTGPKGIDRNNYFYWVIDPDTPPSNYLDMVGQESYGFASVDNNKDGIYDFGFLPSSAWVYSLQGLEIPRSIGGFKAPGTIYSNYIDDTTSTISARGDFEWQINETHLAKTGLELIKHKIKKNQLQNFLTVYEDRRQKYLRGIFDMRNYSIASYQAYSNGTAELPVELYEIIPKTETPTSIADLVAVYKPEYYFEAAKAAAGKRDGYQADPWQMAYYLQDRMEWEGMIVNAGMRFDLWYLGKEYSIAQDNGTYSPRGFASKDRFQMMISPRLGVSHPITDRDVLRFAYNYQNQLPQMQYIFTSKTPEDANVSDVAIRVGNPSLEPQITVTYEVGLSHQLSDDYVLDMTAYFKNLYNYVSTKKERKLGEESITWYKYISEDYGSARGIDMQLEKYLSNFNTWSVAYSLAWAQGNNSYTVVQDEATNLREFPLDWDVRHNMSINYTFRIGQGEEFFVPFTDFILPIDDFVANLNWSFASGSPYTPQSYEGNNNYLDTNSKRKAPTHSANLRITKGIRLPNKASMRFYMEVENLFKKTNIYSVYSKTGSPYFDGADLEDAQLGYVFPELEYTYNLAINNPTYVDSFRGITLGIVFNF
jgi:outer membrane receptor protein involved in Fe transport